MSCAKLILLAGVAVAAIAGPAEAAAIPGLFNTGVDNGGNKLALGATDPHYVLNGNQPAIVYNNGAYVQAADANYLAADANGGYVVNPNVYTLTFDLTGFDPATASLSGLISADNHGTVFLNGAQIGHTDTFSSFTPFSANSGFLPGLNTLSFSILDDGPPSAFAVSQLVGTVDAVGGVPEPATWALMLGGFGLAGAAIRYRTRTRVSFA